MKGTYMNTGHGDNGLGLLKNKETMVGWANPLRVKFQQSNRN